MFTEVMCILMTKLSGINFSMPNIVKKDVIDREKIEEIIDAYRVKFRTNTLKLSFYDSGIIGTGKGYLPAKTIVLEWLLP